ncbi:UDP-glucuronosyltransferase 1-8 [Drosophila busckii]|uniref:UDP-glucuronosyltransferase 1-8 n=1 Tax=Drosophila busckii TaxID=30019 RepID=UPI001432B0FA|nr:UDP-glucuronosyltransferase 1-8 [Drosophila busckii]
MANVQHIQLQNDYDVLKKHYVNSEGQYRQYWNIKQLMIYYESLLGSCRALQELNELSKLQQQLKGPYDLIVYDASYALDCLLHLLPKFAKLPKLGLSGGKLSTDLLALMGAEDTVSAAKIPHFISDLPEQLSYWQRIKNHCMYLTERFLKVSIVLPVLQGMRNGEVNVPSTQLVLLNTHPVLDYVQNMPPNIIEIGGLHIREEATTLPEGLQSFVNGCTEGIIYINLPWLQLMHAEGHNAVKHTIREFQQYCFIWNAKNIKTEHLSNLRVVELEDSMQQDILSQTNVKAFLTHGDSFGLQEAVFNAVPVIVLPVLMDQLNNAKRIEERYLGLRVSLDNFGQNAFSEPLRRLMREDIFDKVLHQARINFRTRQTKPVDQAVWYAEQLIAEPSLYKHLAQPTLNDSSYFVRHSLDVLILPVVFMIAIIVNVIFFVLQIMNDSKLRKEREKKQKLKQIEKLRNKDKDKKSPAKKE